MDSFLNLNIIILENTSVWEIEQSVEINIDLKDKEQKYWWQFWK
jgi:hypothetical protein